MYKRQAAGSAQAVNLGEFWATDQIGGVTHIFDQSDLNDPTIDAVATEVDVASPGNHNSVRMHITGFSNHAGLDPASRSIMTYLDGWMSIWNTNGGTHAPTEVAELEASTINAYTEEGLGAPQKGNTVHACGGNPQNNQIQCASIFNADFSLFEADMETNTYTRIGIWKTGNLTLSPRLKGKMKDTVQAAYDELVANDADGQPNNICSQYSTDGTLLYLAVQNNATDGGVIVMDVSDPTNPTILDAYNDVMAAGCGLVNNPDGEHLWITHGFNKQGDPESVSIWSYAKAQKAKKSGPVQNIYLPTADDKPIYGGDAHGAQYAGLTNSFFWQTMRVDDTMQIISNEGGSGELVNAMDLTAKSGRSVVSPDVLDRSQLGGHMYFSTRGPRPTTAIGSTAGGNDRYNDSSRLAGVDVYSTVFGFDGSFVKHESMESTGGTVYLCPAANYGSNYEVQCADTDPGAVAVSGADPHGTKSLNYLSGF